MQANSSESAGTDAAQRILVAAERLFGERGFNGVSMRHIADAAGVSKANVFHHYSSKLALYEAVLERGSGRFRRLLHLLAVDGRAVTELLHDFDRQHLQTMLQEECSALLFLRQLLETSSGDERRLAEGIVKQSFDLAVAAFAELKREGKLAAHVDPAVLAMTMIGGHIAFFLLRNVLADSEQVAADPDAFSRLMVDQLVAGIRPPGSNTGSED